MNLDSNNYLLLIGQRLQEYHQDLAIQPYNENQSVVVNSYKMEHCKLTDLFLKIIKENDYPGYVWVFTDEDPKGNKLICYYKESLFSDPESEMKDEEFRPNSASALDVKDLKMALNSLEEPLNNTNQNFAIDQEFAAMSLAPREPVTPIPSKRKQKTKPQEKKMMIDRSQKRFLVEPRPIRPISRRVLNLLENNILNNQPYFPDQNR